LEQTCGALQPDFETISETYLEGEMVLAASFLHNGQRVSFVLPLCAVVLISS
jgi:hypothetical protein